jgi:acetylornithine deacetylase
MSTFPTDVISLLQKMVGFDTVNSAISGVPHAEAELANWLEALAKSWGLSTQRLPFGEGDFNLLITHQVDETNPWLLFESHLDVVTVRGMTIEPFAAEIRDGKMWGRGACDTKASGAAMLIALKHYMAQASQSNNVALLFVCDEEVTKRGALAFAHEQLPALPFQPQGVIVGEPTMLEPVVAHNGVTRILVKTHGVAAHSSNPANGRSAISAMMRVIQLLESQYIPSLTATHPLTGKAQSSINVIRAGEQINIIPDYCEIGMDRRIVPGEKTKDVLPQIERVLAPLRAAHPEDRIEVEIGFLDPSLSPHDGAFTDFANGVLARFGEVTPHGVPYGTDASNYAEVGLPAIVLGPGHISQAHTEDEWIALDQVEKAVEVYGALMSTPYKQSHT